MDPLSDVLRAVRLTGAYFYRVEASEPWSVTSLATRELVPRVLPDTEHLMAYHVLVSGSCWGGVIGEPQVRMTPGDVIVFPHGDPHFMSSAAGARVDPRVHGATPERYPGTVYLGQDAHRETTFVCGFLGCDLRPFNPLIAALPRRMHLSGMTGGWLADFPRQVVAESRTGRIGGHSVLTRMAELMFVECLRRYMERMSEDQSGWLRGLADNIVGPALGELHAQPSHPWTIAELARRVASSRTVLAERFRRFVGMPPMQYLTQWRLQLAAERLLAGSEKVASIAAQVGYESEAAFSRAFKRETGQAPAEWRRTRAGRSTNERQTSAEGRRACS